MANRYPRVIDECRNPRSPGFDQAVSEGIPTRAAGQARFYDPAEAGTKIFPRVQIELSHRASQPSDTRRIAMHVDVDVDVGLGISLYFPS